jgi:hypothetical protein
VGSNINSYVKRIVKRKIHIICLIPISKREVHVILKFGEYKKLLELKSIYEITVLENLGSKKFIEQFKKNYIFQGALYVVWLIIWFAVLNPRIFEWFRYMRLLKYETYQLLSVAIPAAAVIIPLVLLYWAAKGFKKNMMIRFAVCIIVGIVYLLSVEQDVYRTLFRMTLNWNKSRALAYGVFFVSKILGFFIPLVIELVVKLVKKGFSKDYTV